MSIKVTVKKHQDFVEVVIKGTYDVHAASGQFSELLAICKITGTSKLLVDYRSLKGIPASTEKVLYAMSIEKQYLDHLASGGKPFHVAYLGSPPQVSTFEPGLELTKARGLPFDIFTDEAEAFAWLNVDAPDRDNETEQPLSDGVEETMA